MEKVFCSRCGFRIWRSGDGMTYVDSYLDDHHTSCQSSLATVLGDEYREEMPKAGHE